MWLDQRGRGRDGRWRWIGSGSTLCGDSPHLPETLYLSAVLPEMALGLWTLFLHGSAFSLFVSTPGNPFRGQQFGLSAISVTDKLCGLQALLLSLDLSFHLRGMGAHWLSSKASVI